MHAAIYLRMRLEQSLSHFTAVLTYMQLQRERALRSGVVRTRSGFRTVGRLRRVIDPAIVCPWRTARLGIGTASHGAICTGSREKSKTADRFTYGRGEICTMRG